MRTIHVGYYRKLWSVETKIMWYAFTIGLLRVLDISTIYCIHQLILTYMFIWGRRVIGISGF